MARRNEQFSISMKREVEKILRGGVPLNANKLIVWVTSHNSRATRRLEVPADQHAARAEIQRFLSGGG